MDLKYFEDLVRRGFGRSLVFFTLISSFLLVLLSFSSLALVLSDQAANVKFQGSLIESGNLQVFIYDDAVAGNLIYNDSFPGSITEGAWSVTLGEQIDLTLEYGKAYYKDYKIDGTDIDFTNMTGGTTERKLFYSPVGLISSEDINPTTILNIAGLNIAGNLNVTGSIISPVIASMPNLSLSQIADNIGNFSAWSNSTFITASNFTNWVNASGLIINWSGIGDNLAWQTLGNWSADKTSYSTTSQANALYAPITEPIALTLGNWSNDKINKILWTDSSGNAAFTTGNVGIGTDSPNYLLTLGDTDSRIGTDTTDANDNKRLQICGAGASVTRGAYINLYGNEYPGNAGNLMLFGGSPGGNISFRLGGTKSIIMTSDGNVGIGTTSPGEKLEVAGNINVTGSYISIIGPTPRVVLNDGTRDWRLTNRQSNSNNFEIQDSTAGQTRLAIDTSGNVGIGTDSPGRKLEIESNDGTVYSSSSGSTGTPDSLKLLGLHNADSTAGASSLQTFSVAGASGTGIFYQGIVGNGVHSDAEYVIGARTGSSSYAERLRIDKDGNVGIGTDNPTNKIHIRFDDTSVYSANVKGDTQGITILNRGDGGVDDTYANLVMQVSNDDGSHNAFGIINLIQDVDTSHASTMTFKLRDSSGDYGEKVRFESDGNVGIGTAAPDSRIHVMQTSDNDDDYGLKVETPQASERVAIRLEHPNHETVLSDNGMYFGIGNASDRDQIVLRDEKVGIGTADPQQDLHVEGDFRQNYHVIKHISPGGSHGGGVYAKIAEYQHGPEWAAGGHLKIKLSGWYYGHLIEDEYILNALSDAGGVEIIDSGYDEFYKLSGIGGTSSHRADILIKTINNTGDPDDGYVEIWIYRHDDYEKHHVTFEGYFKETDDFSGDDPVLNVPGSFTWTSDPGGLIPAKTAFYSTVSYLGGNPTIALNPDGGNVGIGTTSPARQLHITNMMRIDGRESPPSSPVQGDIYLDTSGAMCIYFTDGGWQEMAQDSGGGSCD